MLRRINFWDLKTSGSAQVEEPPSSPASDEDSDDEVCDPDGASSQK